MGVKCSLSQLLMCPTLCPAFPDGSPVIWALPASWPCGLVLWGMGVPGVVGPESAWVGLGTPFVVRAGTWVLSLCAGHTRKPQLGPDWLVFPCRVNLSVPPCGLLWLCDWSAALADAEERQLVASAGLTTPVQS